MTKGLLLIGVYTLGFVLPFLTVGLFTTKLLGLFKKYKNVVKYTVKLGGILMIVMGAMMFTDKMNSITGYLSEPVKESAEKEEVKEKPEQKQRHSAMDFTLTDQYGNQHILSEYKGKTVFLNFWATWCPPCRDEMPDIQKLYEKYSIEEDPSVVILGIAAPDHYREVSEEGVKQFLEDQGYTYPVLMDKTGEVFDQYRISSFPTTLMIAEDGTIFGSLSGSLTEEMMESIINQTIEGSK